MPENVQAAAIAIDENVAEIPAQGRDQAVAVVLVMGADAQQMGRIATIVHEIRQRRLFEPGITIVEQAFLAAHRIGQVLGYDHVAEAQSRAERFRERAHIDRAIRRERCQRRKVRALVADIAIVIVLDDVAAILPGPGNDLVAAPRRQGCPGRILMRRRRVEQRSRALRQIVGDQPVLIDGDACNLGTRSLERQRRAVIAGILDHAERAARKEKPRQQREPFLDAGHDEDAARIGDDAARHHQMIGDRGAQRRKPGRFAILGETDRAAMRQIGLQQASPGLQRKQVGAGSSRKEIVQQAIAGDVKRVLRAPLPQWHRHAHPGDAVTGIGYRLHGRGNRGKLFGDINARSGTRLDDSFHQQQVVGTHDGVAGYCELFG